VFYRLHPIAVSISIQFYINCTSQNHDQCQTLQMDSPLQLAISSII